MIAIMFETSWPSLFDNARSLSIQAGAALFRREDAARLALLVQEGQVALERVLPSQSDAVTCVIEPFSKSIRNTIEPSATTSTSRTRPWLRRRRSSSTTQPSSPKTIRTNPPG